MNELVKISINNGKRAVSARELHCYLESKQDFTNWIKGRIEKYGLIEGSDFIFEMWDLHLNKIIEPKSQMVTGSYKTEFILSMNAAKELSMVEGNDKGKQARQYFIEMEKVALQIKLPTTKELAQMVIDLETEKERLQLTTELQSVELIKQAPKVEYHDKVLQAQNTFNSTTIAKELGMSARAMHHILHKKGVIFFQDNHWMLYSKYQAEGYTKTRTTTYTDSEGEIKTNIITVWTEKGREFLHRKLNSIFIPTQS